MQKQTQGRIVVLAATVLLVAIHIATSVDPSVRLCLAARKAAPPLIWFCYSFVHANMFHLLANCWVLLSVGFLWCLPLWCYAVAYMVACLFGWLESAYGLSTMPVIGFSTVVYALLGMCPLALRSWRSVLRFTGVVTATLVFFQLLIPSVSSVAHAFCYAIGMIIGIINYPFKHRL